MKETVTIEYTETEIKELLYTALQLPRTPQVSLNFIVAKEDMPDDWRAEYPQIPVFKGVRVTIEKERE